MQHFFVKVAKIKKCYYEISMIQLNDEVHDEKYLPKNSAGKVD